jgi:hypothetical protein
MPVDQGGSLTPRLVLLLGMFFEIAIGQRAERDGLAARAPQPQARAYLIWDTVQRGLALQVQPTGYRAYKLIYRYGNRPRWCHIGAADAVGLSDARKIAAELMLEVIRGKDPAAERSGSYAARTSVRRMVGTTGCTRSGNEVARNQECADASCISPGPGARLNLKVGL